VFQDTGTGIDLVARTRDGQLWAVQAKAYDPSNTVTKADVDTFLSESSRSQFAYRLPIATTDHLSGTARRTLVGQEKPVGHLLLSDLLDSQVEWPASPADLRPLRLPVKRPRPHQVAAVRDVVACLDTSPRTRLVMACGTGKTLTALFAAEELASRRTLVLVPSLSLLAQTLAEWLANRTGPMEFKAVCSDATVAAEDRDAPVATTSDLGVPVTTHPDEIATFLRRDGGQVHRVVFATYQSSQRIAEAMTLEAVPAFDPAIADEAHRCAGPVTGDFATILDSDAIRAHRRVFMTATNSSMRFSRGGR
jgi:predicted helicase